MNMIKEKAIELMTALAAMAYEPRIGIAFVCGIVAGILISKLFAKLKN